MDNKIEGKVLSVEASFANEETVLKLDYLRHLNELRGQAIFGEDVAERITKVCDSIESDLGIRVKVFTGDVVVNFTVDTSKMEQALKELCEQTADSAEGIAHSLANVAKRMREL